MNRTKMEEDDWKTVGRSDRFLPWEKKYFTSFEKSCIFAVCYFNNKY